MRIVLNSIQDIEVKKQVEIYPEKGWVNLDVLYCAVCRTDAKIWKEGHRELVLPRVPGHEIVAKYKEQNYIVWPGIACGSCKNCKEGNENLCDELEILGFHKDGGFASNIKVPQDALIPVPDSISTIHACFAEPAGCIINAFKKLQLKSNERILIYGGGTVGLLSALMAKALGAYPVIIEKNETKILKAEEFTSKTSIPVIKDTTESEFDCTLNACADPIAFFNGITRLKKNGRIVHFSGLNKNEQLESNLLNLVHYKELRIIGAYGLTREDMKQGLLLLNKVSDYLDLLIEDIIHPFQVESVMSSVYQAEVYKYIIDFTQQANGKENSNYLTTKKTDVPSTSAVKQFSYYIPKLSKSLLSEAQQKIDHKTKPLGALGKLEDIAVRIALIQNNLSPKLSNKSLFVFAADHGIAEEGVSAFPQDVTRQMVNNFLNQGAAINVLCNYHRIRLSIIDAGVKGKPIQNDALINMRIAEGTKNFALQRAMTLEQAQQSINVGIEVFKSQQAKEAIDIIGLGEMGIANTSSATAIISAITGKTVKECTWRGTGIDDQGLKHKIEVIEKALNYHLPDRNDGLEILSKVGGFEIGAMAGVALSAAAEKCVIVLDGLISTAAGLLAYTINPDIADYFIAGHKSVEKGHNFALEHMGLTPLLDLNMRLGEGTGAALTIDLSDAACHIMREMASFDDAGVSNKSEKLS
ncbi:MAG: nicotinate-nucleotide--dimethylbenzimidazole phosphoribosyltransferase [Salinivirgaceae bacterium]|jgi:nicotinate-nucleotide--dimethylbenzimidazole phosphoribosyltransferase|nr:nicotinate-nucleotide--dimethylbenzimidazole phosphoribosyltransferase [Salinivirgaceae bacterium]